MKAASKFLSAASAVTLSAAMVVPGALAVQFVATSAAEAAVVSRVEVSGNQRIDAETIRNYITIKPGKAFSSSDIDGAVKALFGTGLFSDVQINQVGSTLVVKVAEYQVVNQVLFQNNKKLKDNALAAAVQLKPRGTFSQATLDADVESVKAAYKRIGRDDVTVTTQVMQLGDNRVNVVFNIAEGDRTQIAAINFVGNSAYSSRRLSDIINTKRSSWVSFILRDDVYDDDKLRADQELLRRFYYNHGYADFQVVSAVGELDSATNKYTVTITVQEGDRYTFGDVSVESTIPEVDGKSLESVIETHKGDVYNAKNVEDSIIALTEKVAGSGYAFAQVTPRGDRNFENHTISVVYTIDQGTKAYIERIEIRGNDRTRDYVIRREFDVSEGDAFNQVLIQRAKKRLENLNYFEKVDISTVPGSQPDQVVLVVDVVEKSTGEFSVGAGYSTGGDTAGPSVEGSVTERNFLGRGQFIKLSAGGGKNSRDYSLSFTMCLPSALAALSRHARTLPRMKQAHRPSLSLKPCGRWRDRTASIRTGKALGSPDSHLMAGYRPLETGFCHGNGCPRHRKTDQGRHSGRQGDDSRSRRRRRPLCGRGGGRELSRQEPRPAAPDGL